MENALQWNWQTAAFVLITLAWWLEFVLFPSPKGEDEGDGVRERRSFYQIMAAILVSVGLSIVSAFSGAGQVPAGWGGVIQNVGIAVYAAGLLLRYGSLYSLGQHFSRNVEAKQEQELISSGFYGRLRHPLYLGLFLLALGVPLFLTSAVGAAAAAVLVGGTLNRRMQLEEQLMEDVMGERYRSWKQQRYRFIPYLY